MYKSGTWGWQAKERSRKRNWTRDSEYYSKVRDRHNLLRNELIKKMGGKCVKCGYNTDFRALQIDHVNSGGCREPARSNRVVYYRKVLDSFQKKENVYQLLCANCNFIKRYEKDEFARKHLNRKEVIFNG